MYHGGVSGLAAGICRTDRVALPRIRHQAAVRTLDRGRLSIRSPKTLCLCRSRRLCRAGYYGMFQPGYLTTGFRLCFMVLGRAFACAAVGQHGEQMTKRDRDPGRHHCRRCSVYPDRTNDRLGQFHFDGDVFQYRRGRGWDADTAHLAGRCSGRHRIDGRAQLTGRHLAMAGRWVVVFGM